MLHREIKNMGGEYIPTNPCEVLTQKNIISRFNGLLILFSSIFDICIQILIISIKEFSGICHIALFLEELLYEISIRNQFV